MAVAHPPAVLAPRPTPLLPNECLLIIARHSDGATLQRFRLASKSFQKIADPVLWKEIRLVPNVDCLADFCSLIGSRPIASHVHTLVYDTSWQSLTEELKASYDKASADGTSTCDASRGDILTRCTQAQVKSAEGSGAEMCLLTRVLMSLPNVSNLKSIESAAPVMRDQHPPPFYRSICKRAGVKANISTVGALRYVSHVRSLLLATYATKRKIEHLDLVDIPWTTFFQDTNSLTDPNRSLGDFNFRREIFKDLQYLDISFRNAPSRDPDTHLRALREILKGCENVERLRICMTDYVQKKYSTDYRLFSYLAPLIEGRSMRPLMPKLRELNLQSCICTQNELLNLLLMHSANLRILTLSNISLLRQEENDMRGCWVNVIQSMRHALRLDRVRFRDWLSNGGRQRWYVSQDRIVDPSRLRPQIEGYVTRKFAGSLPPSLEAVAVRPGHEDTPKTRTGVEEEGDWTWTMTYGQSKARYDRADPLYSGNDLFSKDVPLENDVPEPSPGWDDWADYSKPAPPYSKYGSHAKMPPNKGKPVPPAYPHWTYYPTHSGPGGDYGGKPPPLPAKKVVPAHKQPALMSSSWGAFGSSSLSSPDGWFQGIPPATVSHHSMSSSSKSNSTASTNSHPPYFEDDIILDDISYHSPSQHSQSQPNPSYTPSYSSHGSSASFDTFASWSQPPSSYHSSETTAAGYGSSHATSSKPPPHSTYVQPSISWDDTWSDPFDFGPPPGTSFLSPPPPLAPTHPTAASHHGITPQQASVIAAQVQAQSGNPMSMTAAFEIFKHSQIEPFPPDGFTGTKIPIKQKADAKKSKHKPMGAAKMEQELPFGYKFEDMTSQPPPLPEFEKGDTVLKKKVGIETFDEIEEGW